MACKEPPVGYVNIPTAAKMAGVAPQTMYRIVAIEGRIPSETAPGGSRTYYYMKKQAVEKFLETYRKPLRGRPKTRANLYEIVIISCGKLEVLYSTDSPVELSHMYIKMLEHDNKLIRVRADGELLTIHESDKLGNRYHPRIRKTTA